MLRFGKFCIYTDNPEMKKYFCNLVKGSTTKEPYIFQDEIEIIVRDKEDAFFKLIEALEKTKTEFFRSETRWFFKEERDEAEYFTVFFMNPWELDALNAKSFRTKFVEGEGCAKCGKRLKIIPPLYVDRTKLIRKGNPLVNKPDYNIACAYPEIFVSNTFIKAFEGKGFEGLEIKERVEECHGREMPVFNRIEINNILPPISSASEILREMFCEECGEPVCYMNSEIIYDKKDKKMFKDFNMTYEIFGARIPKIIVSQRAYKFLKKFKICGETSVEPIYFC